MHVHKPVKLERLAGTRIVSTPAALDAVDWPQEAIVLRFAADELYITPPLDNPGAVLAHDEYAIVIAEGAFSGAWVDEQHALGLLEHLCEWEIPTARPAFAQGAVAGIPTKLWLTEGRVLFIVSTPYAHDMEERLV